MKLIKLLLGFLILTGCDGDGSSLKNFEYQSLDMPSKFETLVIGEIDVDQLSDKTILSGAICDQLDCNKKSRVELSFPKRYSIHPIENATNRRDLTLSLIHHVTQFEIEESGFLVVFVTDQTVWKIFPLFDRNDPYFNVRDRDGGLDFKVVAEKLAEDWEIEKFVRCSDKSSWTGVSDHILNGINVTCDSNFVNGGYVVSKPEIFIPLFDNGKIGLRHYFATWPIMENEDVLRQKLKIIEQ